MNHQQPQQQQFEQINGQQKQFEQINNQQQFEQISSQPTQFKSINNQQFESVSQQQKQYDSLTSQQQSCIVPVDNFIQPSPVQSFTTYDSPSTVTGSNPASVEQPASSDPLMFEVDSYYASFFVLFHITSQNSILFCASV